MVNQVRRDSIARRDPLAATTRIVLDISPGVIAIAEPPQPNTIKIDLENNGGFLLEHDIAVIDIDYP